MSGIASAEELEITDYEEDDSANSAEEPVAAAMGFGALRQVLLPVRDADYLDDYDRFFVPEWDSLYVPDEDVQEKVALAISLDLPLLLVGPKGSGKNSIISAVAAMVGQPIRRMNMSANVRSRDFVGYRDLVASAVCDPEGEETGEVVQTTVFVDGVLTEAMRRDHWILLDELDMTPPGILATVQAVLEPGRQLVIPANGGEVVQPPGLARSSAKSRASVLEDAESYRQFRIIATANTTGQGDDAGIYAGTQPLNAATLDRFVVIRVGYPPFSREVSILNGRSRLTKDACGVMVRIADKTRELWDKGRCMSPIGTRQLVMWGMMLAELFPHPPRHFDFAKAAAGDLAHEHAAIVSWKMAVGDRLDPDDLGEFEAFFQRESSISRAKISGGGGGRQA